MVVTPTHLLLPLTHYSKDISSLAVQYATDWGEGYWNVREGHLHVEGAEGADFPTAWMGQKEEHHKEAWVAKEGLCPTLVGRPVSTDTKRHQTGWPCDSEGEGGD